MKLPDINVLLHAVNQDAPQHGSARHWVVAAFAETGGVALAWAALLGFVRLSTRRGILNQPLPVADALGLMHDWLAHPNSQLVHPGARHEALVSRLLLGAGTAGNLTTDAHLAAMAIEHGATLVSFDRDFERFAGLSFERLV